MTLPSDLDQQYAEAALLRANQQAEYGKWVAIRNIPIGLVNAFLPGDPVPTSHVERFHWDEMGLVKERAVLIKEREAAEDPTAVVEVGSQPNVDSLAAIADAMTQPESPAPTQPAKAAPKKATTTTTKSDGEQSWLPMVHSRQHRQDSTQPTTRPQHPTEFQQVSFST